MKTIKNVIVADDHEYVCAGVSGLLATVPELTVTGIANNTRELAELLDAAPCDIVISDIGMPGLDGSSNAMSFLRRLLRDPARPKVVVLTMICQPQLLSSLVKLGVSAIVDKRDAAESLLQAVQASVAGELFLSLRAREAVDLLGGVTPSRGALLSEREWEVLRLYAQGMSVRDIAAKLSRSGKTISTQKRSAMRKLSIDRENELVEYAQRIGIA